jgi:hypothetical protein
MQQVGVVRVTCHDIVQVIGDYVVDGLKLRRWDAAEGDEAEKGSEEVVALRRAC